MLNVPARDISQPVHVQTSAALRLTVMNGAVSSYLSIKNDNADSGVIESGVALTSRNYTRDSRVFRNVYSYGLHQGS